MESLIRSLRSLFASLQTVGLRSFVFPLQCFGPPGLFAPLQTVGLTSFVFPLRVISSTQNSQND